MARAPVVATTFADVRGSSAGRQHGAGMPLARGCLGAWSGIVSDAPGGSLRSLPSDAFGDARIDADDADGDGACAVGSEGNAGGGPGHGAWLPHVWPASAEDDCTELKAVRAVVREAGTE